MSKRTPKSRNVGAGSLFGKDMRSRFLDTTRQRYDTMRGRLKRNGIEDTPFTLDEFRADIMKVLDGNEDGAIVCRYCHRPMALEDTATDHAKALSRGGGPELENLDYPCKECNQKKGKLDPKEFLDLLGFLDTQHPLARQDVLARLQKATTLAAGMFRNNAIIDFLKNNGEWAKAVKAVNERKRLKKERFTSF